MQALIIVLKRVERLEELLAEFAANDIKGATILDSTGMAHAMGAGNTKKFLGSLRMLIDPELQESKTIFMVLEDDKVEFVRKAVDKVLGGFDAPDTGIMFGVPVSFAEGLIKK